MPRYRSIFLLLAGAVSAAGADAPAIAPATAEAPFALAPLTLPQINAASPFFTIDGQTVTPLAAPPARLADLQVLRLWAGEAPLQAGDDPAKDVPTLTVYLPPTGKATGSAMIVFPGGGYSHLSPREGLPAVRWLAANGITAFILKYRLGTKYQHPAEMHDAHRAIRYVRANAAAWGLDPKRIGILGFSAGGHLASTAATRFDAGNAASADPVERVSSRPDLQILLYPVISFTDEPIVHKGSRRQLVGATPTTAVLEFLSNDRHVSADTPPAFIVHSTADRAVPPGNSDAYVAGLTKHNVPFVYLRAPIGGHGFGITDDWSSAAMAWLRIQKF